MSDVNPTFCPYPKKWTYEDISITIFQKESIGVIEITISYGEDKKIVIQILQEKYNDRMFNPEEGKEAATKLISSLLKMRYRDLENWEINEQLLTWTENHIRENTNINSIHFHQDLGVSGGFTKKPNGEIKRIYGKQWDHCYSCLASPRIIINDISVTDFWTSIPRTVEVIFYTEGKPKTVMEIHRPYQLYPTDLDFKRVDQLIEMTEKTLHVIPHKELSNRDLCTVLIDWAKEHILEELSIITDVNIFPEFGYSIRVEKTYKHPQKSIISLGELNLINPY